MNFRKLYNIIYFNIFRFHCFMFYKMAQPFYALLKLLGLDGIMSKHHKHENWEDYLLNEVLNDPEKGVSLFLTERIMGILQASLIITLWNLASALFSLNFDYWKYGVYFFLIAGVLVGGYFILNHDHLSDFKEFRSWSVSESRKFATLTVLVIICKLLAFFGSTVLYLTIPIGGKL